MLGVEPALQWPAQTMLLKSQPPQQSQCQWSHMLQPLTLWLLGQQLLELIARAASATVAPYLGQMELGVERALQWPAQTMQPELSAHATPATLAPPPSLGLTELGVEFALRQLATLQIPTMLLELIAHAVMGLLVPSLGPLERGFLLAFHRTS